VVEQETGAARRHLVGQARKTITGVRKEDALTHIEYLAPFAAW
jgi:hypothetical protein